MESCEWGMVMGGCYDGYPPFRIWKGVHELTLPNENNAHLMICSDCLNFYYINDDEKEEGTHYDLSLIDHEALDKWNKEEGKRDFKRAEYLVRIGK